MCVVSDAKREVSCDSAWLHVVEQKKQAACQRPGTRRLLSFSPSVQLLRRPNAGKRGAPESARSRGRLRIAESAAPSIIIEGGRVAYVGR